MATRNRVKSQDAPEYKAKKEFTDAYKAGEDEVIQQALTILSRRFKKLTITSIESSRDSVNFLKLSLGTIEHEVFGVVFLDQRHRVITHEEMFRGTINGTAVYPREVVKQALHHNAAAVIFYHNHPSGLPDPSRADEVLTQRLKEALTLVDIRVLDHIIVGGDQHTSFSERGLL